eukprot:3806701-Amphidinium_carterae.1
MRLWRRRPNRICKVSSTEFMKLSAPRYHEWRVTTMPVYEVGPVCNPSKQSSTAHLVGMSSSTRVFL